MSAYDLSNSACPTPPDPASRSGSVDVGAFPRQLLVFCDGTNNTLNGGKGDTNVLKLAQGIERCNPKDHHQIVWYDPGVGAAVSLPEATLSSQFRGYLKRLWGLAFGDGVYENVAQAITFLANNYQEGDQIFLFGFSRGAFTARAVGGVINQYGLPHPNHLHLLPLLIQRYFSAVNKQSKQDQAIVEQAQLMTQARKPFIHFVGVWDTVDEVGFPLPGLTRRIRNGNTLADKCFVHVRHVVALDEHRRLFRPRLYQETGAQGHTANRLGQTPRAGSLKQVALPGCHSDIGGGYDAPGLSDRALAWMVDEATAPGVDLRIGSYKAVPQPGNTAAQTRLQSELKSTFGWALLGQRVRDASSALAPLVNPQGLPTLAQPLSSVWQKKSVARLLWWVVAVVAVGLSLAWLSQVAEPLAIATWQLQAGFEQSLGLPATGDDIARHLWRDLLFIASLALLLSLPNSAGFAYMAGQRRVGQVPPRWLNLLGVALPVYIAADLLENALTAWLLWLLPSTGGITSLVAFLMSLAAAAKFIALIGAGALALVGVAVGAATWFRGRP